MLNEIIKSTRLHLAFTCAILLLAIIRIYVAASSLTSDNICRKDFVQTYLIARSYLGDIPPYGDPNILIKEYLPQCVGTTIYLHPLPYPPTQAPFFFWLGLLNFKTACLSWFLLSTFGIIISILAVTKEQCISNKIILCGLPFIFNLGFTDLIVGQFNFILALLIVYLIKNKNELVKGGVLATIFGIKMFGIPLLLLYILQKRWRLLKAFFVTFSIIISFTLLGFQLSDLQEYYFYVASAHSNLYINCSKNGSLWTLPVRVFEGTSAGIMAGPIFDPILKLPFSVIPFTKYVIGIVTFLAVQLVKNKRAAELRAILICFLFTPVIWFHTLIAIYPLLLKFKLSTFKKYLILISFIIVEIFASKMDGYDYQIFPFFYGLLFIAPSLFAIFLMFQKEKDNDN